MKVCILFFVLIFGLPSGRASAMKEPDGAPSHWSEPVYGCDHCTDAQYDAIARSLDAGRHMVADFNENAPRVFETSEAGMPSGALIKPVVPNEREQAWFDLARRMWAGPSPIHFAETDLKPVLREREIDRTADSLPLAAALQTDLIDALEELLPAIAPSAYASEKTMACLAKKACAPPTIKQALLARDVVVDLARGGRVMISWPAGKSPSIVAVADASGKVASMPDPNDFSRGKVYLYEGDAKAKKQMANYMRRVGFKVDVKDDGEPFECVRKGENTICRDVRVESRKLVGIMN
jgi:hypothetical protein